VIDPDDIDRIAGRIVNGHERAMAERIFTDLTRALATGGMLTSRDMRVLEQAAAINAERVQRALVRYAPRISAEVRELVTEVLAEADVRDLTALSRLYGGAPTAGMNAVAERMARETAEGLALVIARDNIRMAEHFTALWYDVTAQAITEWNHGSMARDRVIARAVRRLAREGLVTIDYASGVKSRLDVAVRRHIVSQIGQASGRMTMRRLDEFGHDLVRTSAHFGARPSHAPWQGRIFSRTGSGGYPDFYAVTGYGTGAGLQGWNCRHTFGPAFPDDPETPDLPERVNGMTGAEYYEATQKQRRYERAIRNSKAEIAAFQTAGLDSTSDEVVSARLKLGRYQRAVRDLLAETGLERRYDLERAFGVPYQPRALGR